MNKFEFIIQVQPPPQHHNLQNTTEFNNMVYGKTSVDDEIVLSSPTSPVPQYEEIPIKSPSQNVNEPLYHSIK